MKYVSATCAAKAAGLSRAQIIVRAKKGFIPGATQIDNGVWLIPADWAKKRELEREERVLSVSVTKAASIAGVSRTAIYKAIDTGRLKAAGYKKGEKTAWAVDPTSLQQYIEKK